MKKMSTDVEVLELFEKYIKAAIMKMFQQGITNTWNKRKKFFQWRNKDIKKNQINILELKSTIMKTFLNSMDGPNSRREGLEKKMWTLI